MKIFCFQLSTNEWDEILMSRKLISSWGGSRKLPYAFTEQGIYMLMTVLKGDLATKQSIALIDTFLFISMQLERNRLEKNRVNY